jgi:hypothetical protein
VNIVNQKSPEAFRFPGSFKRGKMDYVPYFNHVAALPRMVIVTAPRAGSDFFQSLLDGHPQILQLPGQFQFYEFWTSALCREDLEDLIQEFVWHRFHLPKFKSRYQIDERWNMLGEHKSDSFEVSIPEFVNHLRQLMEGRAITSRNFFVAVHAAYALASQRVLKMERGCVEEQPQPDKHAEALVNSGGLRLVEDDTAALRHFSSTLSSQEVMGARLLVCHLHEYYHLPAFANDFQDVRVIYCTRDPRSALVSTVEHLMCDYNRRNLHFLRYWLKWIFADAEQVLPVTAKVKALPLERLHKHGISVLEEFCRDFGLDYHPCLLESTWQGKQWWGDARSKKFLDGLNFRLLEKPWENKLHRVDVFLLEFLLGERMSTYGHTPSAAPKRWHFLIAPLLLFVPMKYEWQIALDHFKASPSAGRKLFSAVISLVSYAGRVLLYGRYFLRRLRGGVFIAPEQYGVKSSAVQGSRN